MCVTACSRDLALALEPGASTRVYTLGSAKHERTLDPSSAEYSELSSWLRQNQSGWSRLVATPPANGLLVSSGRFHLQFTGRTALVTTSEGVFTKDVAESEYAFLLADATPNTSLERTRER